MIVWYLLYYYKQRAVIAEMKKSLEEIISLFMQIYN